MSWAETIFLANKIKAQRKYAASDSVLAILGSSMNFFVSEKNYVQIENSNFKALADGSIRLKFICESIEENQSYADFRVTASGNGALETFIISYKEDNPSEKTFVAVGDIPIKKGKIYTFEAKRDSSVATFYLQEIQVCGSIVDLSMLEYTTY